MKAIPDKDPIEHLQCFSCKRDGQQMLFWSRTHSTPFLSRILLHKDEETGAYYRDEYDVILEDYKNLCSYTVHTGLHPQIVLSPLFGDVNSIQESRVGFIWSLIETEYYMKGMLMCAIAYIDATNIVTVAFNRFGSQVVDTSTLDPDLYMQYRDEFTRTFSLGDSFFGADLLFRINPEKELADVFHQMQLLGFIQDCKHFLSEHSIHEKRQPV